MKLLLSLMALIALNFTTIQAQNWGENVYQYGEFYPGHIVKTDGEKIEGYIKFSDRYTLQNKVAFYTDPKNKKTKEVYDTEDLKSYQFADKTYHVIHYSGGLFKKPLKAVLLAEDGCIKKYVWYNQAEGIAFMKRGAGESYEDYEIRRFPSDVIYLKEGEEYPVSMTYFALKFTSKMSEFLIDYTELSEKIANKEKGYGILGFDNVLAEYNAWCANQ